MNAVMPPTATQQDPSARASDLPANRRHRQRRFYPIAAICTVQAVLSLTLVWSNTAFGDEADYLAVGRLEWAHWLYGTSWPSAYADGALSGSPTIYPPLGALADSFGGLAGARIFSLALMLGATILLYLTASRLIGHGGAVAGSAIWALSEPALRLAFATYDPLSVSLTALSAWLVVQAIHRHRGRALMAAAAAAAALALANATAYSGIVIDPVVVGFAFLMCLPRIRALRALLWATCFTIGCGAFFGLLMTASHSWRGLLFTVIARSKSDYQSTQLVVNDIWQYSGLILCLAVVGIFLAIGTESRQRGAMMALLGCAAFIVPAAQLHDQTGWSLDKHLAYGVWFASIAAGYTCSKLIRWLPWASRRFAVVCCVIALAYPASNSWASAWRVYHSWANANSFITKFAPIAERSSGVIYPADQYHIAEYYIPQVAWTRWTTKLPLDPISIRPANRESYYTRQLSRINYGAIALFYSTTFSSAPEMPSTLLLSPSSSGTSQRLLGLVGEGSGEPGLPALTQALESNRQYHLVSVGPFDDARGYGLYAIWQKQAQP
jgi:hypothetical protein